MRDYLVFQLYGPLASWGEIAVGELRHSASHPSRSALLGLLGAALGVRRDDAAAQAALADGYQFAVKQLAGGAPLRDYHTVQAPALSKKITHRTRRQEMADPDKLNTLLTSREYYADSFYVVAVQAQPDAPHTLDQLQHALEHPVFTLYLGRKSCPLALPLAPKILPGVSLKAALDSGSWPTLITFKLPGRRAARYFWEVDMDADGLSPSQTHTRHDQPLSRQRWQFAPRQEHSQPVSAPAPAGEPA